MNFARGLHASALAAASVLLGACTKPSPSPALARQATRSDADSARLVPYLYGAAEYGYVGRDGAPAFAARFPYARRFHEGRAAVATRDYKWGFVDGDGVTVIPLRYDLVGDFKDGKARAFRFKKPVPGPTGGVLISGELTEVAVDRNGNESGSRSTSVNVLPDLAAFARPVFEEHAPAPPSPPARWATFAAGGGKLGLREIASGREVFPGKYGDFRMIEDVDGSGVKFLAARTANDTPPPGPSWTVYDLSGKPLFERAFDVGAYSSEGCAVVSEMLEDGNSVWSAIDGAGHRVVAVPFAHGAFAFRDGIAEVYVEDVESVFVGHDGRLFAELGPIDARHRAVGRKVVPFDAGAR